jgi:eukaryotic-like serine/threonine-protein kinase
MRRQRVQPLQADDPRRVGDYAVLGRLGRGAMGTVYLGRSPGGRLVAVKVARLDLAEDLRFRDRFRQEVAIARAVGGFWTAAVVDADPEAARPWLATEYVPGPTLSEAVTEHGPLPPPAVHRLVAGLAEALLAIHAAGLVHRDLKPSNVLLAPDGPRVIDFGIAKALQTAGLTRTGLLVGTPGFLSPEQIEGRDLSPASDVFALGAVLVYAATGHGPFGQGDIAALMYRAVHGEPDLAGVPAPLRAVAARCLQPRPEQRPAPAELLAEVGTPDTDEWLPEPVRTLVAERTEVLPPVAPTRVPTRRYTVPGRSPGASGSARSSGSSASAGAAANGAASAAGAAANGAASAAGAAANGGGPASPGGPGPLGGPAPGGTRPRERPAQAGPAQARGAAPASAGSAAPADAPSRPGPAPVPGLAAPASAPWPVPAPAHRPERARWPGSSAPGMPAPGMPARRQPAAPLPLPVAPWWPPAPPNGARPAPPAAGSRATFRTSRLSALLLGGASAVGSLVCASISRGQADVGANGSSFAFFVAFVLLGMSAARPLLVLARPKRWVEVSGDGLTLGRGMRRRVLPWSDLARVRVVERNRRPWLVVWLSRPEPHRRSMAVEYPQEHGGFRVFPVGHERRRPARDREVRELRAALGWYGRSAYDPSP